MSSSQTLKRLEVEIQQIWEDMKMFRAELDPSKPKYFATFAFPYSNGALHLGHGFTLSKAVFAAAYKRLQGYNVLLPQGFHASGTPIPACAKKVADKDVDQLKALADMGICQEDICKFSDPHHWIKTFVPKAVDVMTQMGCGIDWRRTFVTTDLSPQYDSFVRWQFTKLHRLGLLEKGEKVIIYSVQDEQPCSDHDRSFGEGVKPIKVVLEQALDDEGVTWYRLDKSCSTFFACRSGTTVMYVDVDLTSSFYHQKIVSEINQEDVKLVDQQLSWEKSSIEYWEPESKVITRSGERCIVAKIPQWYIDYENSDWRAKAAEALSDLKVYNPEVKTQLEAAITDLQVWGCSRTRGLGTKLPCDGQYIIDSLSDSTIYMAYYTVAHRVEELKPFQFEVWDSIFCGTSLPVTADVSVDLIQELRQEFLYWYPMDLRVSGKDLIGNHLIFSLFNHAGLLVIGLSPRSYWCNGHVFLNGSKMAKSTGNFMTLEQAVNNWSADAVRLTLAGAGDKLDDANFEAKQADSAVLRLANELKWMREQKDNVSVLRAQQELNIADKLFLSRINENIEQTKAAYERMRYREVVLNGWFGMLSARDDYRDALSKYMPLQRDCVFTWIRTVAKLMAPITPHFCEGIHRNILHNAGSVITSGYPKSTQIKSNARESLYILSLIKQIRKSCRTVSNAGFVVQVTVAKPLEGWKNELAEDIRTGAISSVEHAIDKYVPSYGSRAQVIPLYKFIVCQPTKVLLDEKQVILDNLDSITQLTGLDSSQIVLKQSEQVPHTKPRTELMNE